MRTLRQRWTTATLAIALGADLACLTAQDNTPTPQDELEGRGEAAQAQDNKASEADDIRPGGMRHSEPLKLWLGKRTDDIRAEYFDTRGTRIESKVKPIMTEAGEINLYGHSQWVIEFDPEGLDRTESPPPADVELANKRIAELPPGKELDAAVEALQKAEEKAFARWEQSLTGRGYNDTLQLILDRDGPNRHVLWADARCTRIQSYGEPIIKKDGDKWVIEFKEEKHVASNSRGHAEAEINNMSDDLAIDAVVYITILSVIALGFGLVAWLKRKYWLAVLFPWVGAIRLARPESWWARQFYANFPEKMDKATVRYAGRRASDKWLAIACFILASAIGILMDTTWFQEITGQVESPATATSEPAQTKGMKVNLPSGQSGETWSGGDYISVSVDANGNPYFDKTEMTYNALTAKLKQVHDENPEAKVFIRGDADSVHFNIIRVLDILRSVGFYKVAFEVRSEDPAPQPMKGIKVALPSNVQPPPNQVKDYVSIRVGAGNAISFDGQYVQDEEIMSRLYRLHEANPNIKVSISGEGMARHGDVITVLDKVRRAGIQKVGYQIRAAKPGDAHRQKGIELFHAKQFAEAIQEFDRAVQAAPNDPSAYRDRGTAYRAAARAAEAAGDGGAAGARYSSALADFSKEIELAPKEAAGYVERAQTEDLGRQYDAALADANKALELKPDDLVSIKFRGFAYVGLNHWDKAVADFTVAIQRDPNDPQSYDRRAWANRNLQNFPAAIEDYGALLQKNPANEDALVKRGATYAGMMEYEKAIVDYQAALKIKPDDYDTVQRMQYAQTQLARQRKGERRIPRD
jgi:biopolymer transport protein ExbD/regulator of sirC expression with transglutaminase-like and TPR domain